MHPRGERERRLLEVWKDEARPAAAENKAQVFALLERLGYSIEPLDSTNYLALPPS